MPTTPAAGLTSSPARTAVRLLAQLVGFAVLLFATRFVARPHLAMRLDEECHIGGIAVDVLAHGIRFPLLVYPQNEYDNGALFSGVLTALSFSLLGRNLLALKLVMHLLSAAGAVAALWLLRGCLADLGVTSRRVRWTATAALIVAIALAPRLVTGCLMCNVGFGTPAEGSAINAVLLALFASRCHVRSAARTAALWLAIGFAFFLNKGSILVIPVLGLAELALSWTARLRLLAALGGVALGVLPELLVGAQRQGVGWTAILGMVARNARGFPQAVIQGMLSLADSRPELLAAWVLGLCVGIAALLRSARRLPGGWRAVAGEHGLFSLGLVVGAGILYAVAISVMAQGGLEYYAVYGYPILAVLFAVLVAQVCAGVGMRWGAPAELGSCAVALVVTLVLHRPDALTLGLAQVAELWRNRAGAACSWRFAEGFAREQRFGLAAPGQSSEQHAIERCRLLSEPAQVLDCIGGIARDMHFHRAARVQGAPPAGLSAQEQGAFAYYYGIRRNGDAAPCDDFTSAELRGECLAGVQMDCLFQGDFATRLLSAHGLERPRCPIPEPPMDGYWASLRRGFLAAAPGAGPDLSSRIGRDQFPPRCKPVFDACY